MSNPSVAVVILNWNGIAFLKKFLPSVAASTYPDLSIVVADNASTDGSLTYIREHFPQVNIVINHANLGFAGGYNNALRQVQADYYAILNNDVEVSPGWIEPVIALMQSDPLIAACQPKILSYADRKTFEHAGACGGWIDSLGYPFCRGRIFEVCERDSGQYDEPQEIFWASGAALFIKASLFHKFHGFDEYFFAHQEEIDLCWRLQHAGYKIMVQPASVVYHVGGGSLPMGDKRKVYLNFRNNLIMLCKNLPAAERVIKIPARLALDAAAALKNLLSGNVNGAAAIIKAQLHFCRWLVSPKKHTFSPAQYSPRLGGKFRGLVALQYYINRKKTFSEIVKNKK